MFFIHESGLKVHIFELKAICSRPNKTDMCVPMIESRDETHSLHLVPYYTYDTEILDSVSKDSELYKACDEYICEHKKELCLDMSETIINKLKGYSDAIAQNLEQANAQEIFNELSSYHKGTEVLNFTLNFSFQSDCDSELRLVIQDISINSASLIKHIGKEWEGWNGFKSETETLDSKGTEPKTGYD